MSVSESIDHIRKLSPKLNEATNTAKAVIEAAEKFLEKCGVGIPVEVYVSETEAIAVLNDDGEKTGRHSWMQLYLGYQRVTGKYHLVTVGRTMSGCRDNCGDYHNTLIESERVTPWASAPRDEKLATFSKLADLLKEIAQEATKSLEAVNASGDESAAIMRALTQ